MNVSEILLEPCYSMVYEHLLRVEEYGLRVNEMPPHLSILTHEKEDKYFFSDPHIFEGVDQSNLGLEILIQLNKHTKEYKGFVYWCIIETVEEGDRLFIMVFGKGDPQPLAFFTDLNIKEGDFEFLDIEKVPFLNIDYNLEIPKEM